MCFIKEFKKIIANRTQSTAAFGNVKNYINTYAGSGNVCGSFQ